TTPEEPSFTGSRALRIVCGAFMTPTTLRVLAAVLGVALVPASGVLAQPKVTIKMGDNLPDRSNTWGAIVEQINREFKAAHAGVEIVTESYPDQPYQQKIKTYATAKH